MRGRFLEFLRYVDFIKDQHVKIQIFMSKLPSIFSDKIQYDGPKMLEEEIRRAKCLHDHHKGGSAFQITWVNKNKVNLEKIKKGYKPPSFRNSFQG
jgi:hypothetical protein